MSRRPPDARALTEHGDFVRALARKLVGDPHAADDLAQETMLAALQRPPADHSNLRGWLAAVARNLANMGRRGAGRRAARERAVARPESAGGATDEIAARLEWQERIVGAVRELEEPYRTTLVYRFLEQMEPAAIARRMDVDRKTVYTRLHRGLDRIRARFDREAGDRRTWLLALLPLTLGADSIPVPVAETAVRGGVAIAAGLIAASFLAGRVVAPAPTQVVPRAAPATLPPAPGTPGIVARSAGADRDVTAPWVAAIAAAPEHYMALMPIALRIAALPPDDGWKVMRAAFERIDSSFKRRQLLKGFDARAVHPRIFDILHLAVTDPDPEVRSAGCWELAWYAFRDFSADPAAYAAWRERWRAEDAGATVRAGALAWVERLRRLPMPEVEVELRTVSFPVGGEFAARRVPHLRGPGRDRLGLRGALRDAGLLDLAAAWLDREDLGDEAKQALCAWVDELEPDESYVRRLFLPVLETPDAHPALRLHAACRALGRPEHGWAVDPLLAAYARVDRRADLLAITRALVAIGDARAVPAMVDVLAGNDTGSVRQTVGWGLSRFAKLPHDASRDGAWWRDWLRAQRGEPGR